MNDATAIHSFLQSHTVQNTLINTGFPRVIHPMLSKALSSLDTDQNSLLDVLDTGTGTEQII